MNMIEQGLLSHFSLSNVHTEGRDGKKKRVCVGEGMEGRRVCRGGDGRKKRVCVGEGMEGKRECV